MKKKHLLAMAFSAMLAFGLCACGNTGNSTTSQAAGEDATTLHLINNKKDAFLYVENPMYNRCLNFNDHLWRSLLIMEPNMTDLKGDLAQSWEAKDATHYTFTLKDVKWSDGSKLTGDDVAFTFALLLKANPVNSNMKKAASAIKGADAVLDGSADELSGITVDGNTIAIELAKPFADFEAVCSQIPVMPKEALKDADPLEIQKDDYFKNPITDGEYKVKELNPNNFMTLELNENFEGTKPAFDSVVINHLEDPIAAAQSGQVDFWVTNKPEEISEFGALKNFSDFTGNSIYYRYLVVNYLNENGEATGPLAKPEVRQALMYAIDRNAIVDAYFKGFGVADTSGVAPTNVNYNKDQNTYNFDTNKAHKMLEDAGFDFDQTLKIRYYYGDQTSINVMEAIGSMLGDAGVKCDVRKFENDGTTELWQIRDYDLALKGLGALTLSEWYNEYTNDNYAKVIGEINPEFKGLIESYNTTVDKDARKDILNKLQTTEQDYFYKMPLYSVNNETFVNTDKVQLPEDIEFANPFCYYNTRFDEWKTK